MTPQQVADVLAGKYVDIDRDTLDTIVADTYLLLNGDLTLDDFKDQP